MYSCGPPLMDVQEWDDQHELTYSSYVRTRVVILKTCRRRWMIGRNGERRSGISAQAARHDDDDDNPHKRTHTPTALTNLQSQIKIPTKSKRFLTVFFSIFDSFHFVNCLMIVVLWKSPWNPGVMVYIPWN